MTDKEIEALYAGFREYMIKVQGYGTCPECVWFKEWEEWKEKVFSGIEEKADEQTS